MKLLSILLGLLGVYACSAQYSPQSYVDRQCGTDLNNLWLDVVAVVDNSHGMTNGGVQSVAANIASVFSSGTRLGSTPNEPRTTRVGLVSYNSAAKVDADLNQFQDLAGLYNGVFHDLSAVVDTTDSYLATGLNAAEELLQSQSFNTTRDHYKKVIIVYASEYKGDGELDPLPVANRLKLSRVNIITVAYPQSGEDGLLQNLTQIANPGFSFSSDAGSLVNKIQNALLQSNCFCPDGWIQYRESYSDPTSSRYGVCIQAVALPASWLAAKLSCSNKRTKANLATEFSQSKHDFIFNVAQNTTRFSPPYQYHIGLNYVSGSWVWTQPTGRQQVPLQQPYMWLPGYPQSVSTQSGVMNQQSGQRTEWQNIATMTGSYNYVCETYSCDTDNYCDS